MQTQTDVGLIKKTSVTIFLLIDIVIKISRSLFLLELKKETFLSFLQVCISVTIFCLISFVEQSGCLPDVNSMMTKEKKVF